MDESDPEDTPTATDDCVAPSSTTVDASEPEDTTTDTDDATDLSEPLISPNAGDFFTSLPLTDTPKLDRALVTAQTIAPGDMVTRFQRLQKSLKREMEETWADMQNKMQTALAVDRAEWEMILTELRDTKKALDEDRAERETDRTLLKATLTKAMDTQGAQMVTFMTELKGVVHTNVGQKLVFCYL